MRNLFDPLAGDYARGRPHYPPALFDALGALTGTGVVELGAGTGIATGGLVARGARVLALEPGASMLAHLRAALPDVACARAVAEALPLADASTDLVCMAQAWHWVDVDTAGAEVVRVLRPGGRLAVWWNSVDAAGQPWWEWQLDRLEERSDWRRDYRDRDHGAELLATGRFREVRRITVRWERSLGLEDYAAWLRSKSYVAALGPDSEPFVEQACAVLRVAFPDGRVVEPFRTDLWLAVPGRDRATAGG